MFFSVYVRSVTPIASTYMAKSVAYDVFAWPIFGIFEMPKVAVKKIGENGPKTNAYITKKLAAAIKHDRKRFSFLHANIFDFIIFTKGRHTGRSMYSVNIAEKNPFNVSHKVKYDCDRFS